MKRLTPPKRASLDEDYRLIAAAKRPRPHGRTLLRIASKVASSLTAYAAASPNLHGMSKQEFGLKETKALLHAYASSTPPLQALKRAIRKSTRQSAKRCQYCASLNPEPSTLDHYLEQKQFPQFAIFHRNLVPSCSDCNRDRLATIRGGERCVIHFYDDPVEHFPVMLIATIDDDTTATLQAAFSVVTSVTHDPSHGLFGRHFFSLKLAERFRRVSADELTEILDAVVDAQLPPWGGAVFDRSMATQQLERTAASERRRWGNNAWRAALTEAAARSVSFLYECERQWGAR